MDICRLQGLISCLLTYIYNLSNYSFLIQYIYQAHYDAVQQRKKGSSRQASLKSGNLAMTVEEEDDEKEKQATEEEGMLSGKRRHFTMPESVV